MFCDGDASPAESDFEITTLTYKLSVIHPLFLVVHRILVEHVTLNFILLLFL